MVILALILCTLGAGILAVLTFQMESLDLPILFMISMLPLFFGGSAWATKDSVGEKEKISMISRISGAVVLLGIFIFTAHQYISLWSVITDIWKQVLLVWFAAVSLFLFWIACKGSPEPDKVKAPKANKQS